LTSYEALSGQAADQEAWFVMRQASA